MSAVPLSDPAAKRRIGDILLAQGLATAEQLSDAMEEQERTQQPLGQILVQQGAITRLELASALAEQWSDPSASILSYPRSAPAAVVPPTPDAEAQYAARLQEAVADLARRVQSNKPLEGIDERVEELSRRIEATLARTQHIEAAVATLAESLEGVTGGVEEAFYALQSGTADLAGDLARIERTVSDLATRPVEASQPDAQVAAAVEELRAIVAALDGRLAERLDRLEVAAGDSALRADVESQAATLEDVRTVLRELELRPAGTPQVDDRLARIEEQIEAAATSQHQLARIVEALDERSGESAGEDPRVESALAWLGSLESRFEVEQGDVADLRALVATQQEERVEGRVDELAQNVEMVRGEIARISESALGAEDNSARIDALGAQVGDLIRDRPETSALAAKLEALEARLSDGVVTPDALARAVEGLASDGGETSALAAKLEALEARLADGVVTPDALASAIERTQNERPSSEADERFVELSSDLAALRVELAGLADAVADAPRDGRDAHLDEINARVDELATGRRDHETLMGRLDALETARASDIDTVDVLARAMDRIRHDLSAAPERPPAETSDVADAVAALGERIAALESSRSDEPAQALPAPELAAELDRFRLMIERVGLHLGEHDRALADLAPTRSVPERLDELAAHVEQLAESGRASAGDGAAMGLSGDVNTLLRRLEEAETASQSDGEKLMNRLERMASSLDWRLQRLETDDAE